MASEDHSSSRDLAQAGGVKPSREAELQALLARVEAATGDDRELDAALEVVARNAEAAGAGLPPEHWAKWRAGPAGHVGDGHTAYYAKTFTASLDAALALVERCGTEGIDAAQLLHDSLEDMANGGWRDDQPLAPQIALYALAALLRRLIDARPV